MGNKNNLRIKGFTLAEVLITLLLSTLIMAGLMSLWYFSIKTWGVERVRSTLRSDLELAMERIKDDVRLSSSNQLYFYPQNSSECEAMSLSQASNPDADGFINVDAGGIVWYRTVVYHIFTNPSTGIKELRRTMFWPRDNNWTSSQFQNQLDSVVSTGDGQSSTGSMTTQTEMVFLNLDELSIFPKTAQFDFYSSVLQRSNNISFGSLKLASGAHNLKFEVVGKNIFATNFNIGIDSLSLTPSGGIREGEAYIPPVASSGKTASSEDMSGVGSYSGNNQLLYNSSAIGDYITLSLNYDQWLESNFQDFIFNNCIREGTNPSIRLAARSESGQDWTADFQTGVSPSDYSSGLEDTSVRLVIANSSIFLDNAVMVRVKFKAHSSMPLKITKAFISERVPGTQNSVPGTSVQLYFSDAPIIEGEAPTGEGSVGLGPESILISAGFYTYSNWAYFTIDRTSGKDYLVTFHITSESGNGNVTYWPAPSGTNSYTASGDVASNDAWILFNTSSYIYSSGEIQGWINEGTVTSTIYDTKLTAPNFNQISWEEDSLPNTSVSFKVRAGNDPALSDAPDWDGLASYSVSPSVLSGVDSKRYVQFQATLTSLSPYDNLPAFDDCAINWPGLTALVDINGYFTKGPQYGIIKLTVDGNELTKGLEITMSNTEDFQGKVYTVSLSSEVSPRNTGK